MEQRLHFPTKEFGLKDFFEEEVLNPRIVRQTLGISYKVTSEEIDAAGSSPLGKLSLRRRFGFGPEVLGFKDLGPFTPVDEISVSTSLTARERRFVISALTRFLDTYPNKNISIMSSGPDKLHPSSFGTFRSLFGDRVSIN